MSTVTASEAKTRFGELLNRVAKGEAVVITRYEKTVARMIPEGGQSLEDIRKTVAGLQALQELIRTRAKGRTKLSDAEVRSATEEGRL
ncbi:MAG: type II toxin-antitoxin system prevent-host-death family antitoxin [Verrucomicrobiota bacterium]